MKTKIKYIYTSYPREYDREVRVQHSNYTFEKNKKIKKT